MAGVLSMERLFSPIGILLFYRPGHQMCLNIVSEVREEELNGFHNESRISMRQVWLNVIQVCALCFIPKV